MALPYEYTPNIWPLLASALFLSVMGFYAYRDRTMPGAVPFPIMSTIGASLQQKPEFQVQEIKGLFSDIMDKLDAAPPDVILFELAATLPDFAIPLLRRYPTIRLIEVDLTNNKMLLLTGEPSRLMTMDDLTNVIEGGPTSRNLSEEAH